MLNQNTRSLVKMPGQLNAQAAAQLSQQGITNVIWLFAIFALVCLFQVFHVPFYVWLILMILGCQTPATTIFIFAATQVVGMSAIPGMSSTQSFLAIWVVRHCFTFISGELLGPIRSVMWFMLPLMGWSLVAGVVNDNQGQTIQLLNAFPMAVIAIREYRRVDKQRRHIVTLAIALACFLSILPYWCSKVGVTFGGSLDGQLAPTTLFYGGEQRVVQGDNLRGGLQRLALAGADYNYAGSCMDICIAALLSLFVFPPPGRSLVSRISRWSCLAAIILCLPATMATLSRSTVIGVAVAIATPFCLYLAGNRRQDILKYLGGALASLGAMAIVGVIAWGVLGNELQEYGAALWNFQLTIGSGEEGGRMHVFQRGIDALTGASGSPLTGNVTEQGQCNHNIYFDAASYSGWPGLLMLIWLTLYPCTLLRRRGKTLSKDQANILSIYLLALFAGLSLSLLNFKLLWISWAILTDECRTIHSRSAQGFHAPRPALR